MALKDLKSDLSKFRMPKKEPLENKARVKIEQTQNQTPLSSMTESAPKIPRFRTTPNAEHFGDEVNPQIVVQTEKFKGETSVEPMSRESKFLGETNPSKMDNSEKFLGETNPSKMDNSEKFLGETNPAPMSLEGSIFLGQTDPQRVNQVEKFKGETSVEPMSLEEKFLGQTTPDKMDNSPNYLGETNPTPMSLEERYLGETNPNKMDNSERFLGETSPKSAEPTSKFLGETTPTTAEPTSQFLGETNPKSVEPTSKFLGETTPTTAEPTSKFLGETDPNIVQQGDKFKGETTTENVPQGDKFKGETDPTKFDNSSNFIRFSNEKISSPFATEPNQMNLDAKFLGEYTPMIHEIPLGYGQFLGETTPTEVEQGDKFKGETDPTVMSLGDKFKGETTPAGFPYILRQENEGKDPGEVNYIQDIHARGFTSKFQPKDPSKFIGVSPDQTSFNTATSLYGNFSDSFDGLSFTPGYGKFKLSKETGNTQRYNFESKYYVDTQLTNPSISKLHEMRSSPSFLDKMYDKFNLRDDAFNLGTAAFAHPLILRGIQRKGLDKGEPQKWGFGFPVDDGLVRGGIVTAVDRAVVDAVRLGKWMISVQGLLWGIKNLGLQASNSNVETLTGKRLTKVWTPINTIASTLGGFIGLHPRRHGIFPLPESANPEKYETVQKGKRVTHTADPALAAPITGNRLVGLWTESFITIGDVSKSLTDNGIPFARLQSLGGPNSLYGLIPGGRVPTRNENTRPDDFIGYTIFNQYATFRLESDGSRVAEGNTRALDISNVGTSEDNFGGKTELGKKISPYQTFNPTKKPTSDPNFTGNQKVGIIHNDEFTYEKNRSSEIPTGSPDDYKGNDLGLIWDSYTTQGRPSDGALNVEATHTSKDTPFEKLKNTEGNTHPIEKNETAAELIKSYETLAYGDIPTRPAGDTSVNDFRQNFTSKLGYRDADYKKGIEAKFGLPNHALSIGKDKSDYNNPDFTVIDKINALDLNGTGDDLVNFWIKADGGSKTQFRGTVSGITETFSPSWDSFKYNGRADQAYKYTTFERSLSLNFKAYASSRAEMKPMYKKLQYLATMTMPVYGGGGYHGVLVTFRLGDLFNKKLAFIESLTYTQSDETPWDINLDKKLGQLPMGMDIAIGFKILDGTRPERGAGIYDWKEI
jgi:hypothetical protein